MFTYKALGLIWLIILALFGVSGFGVGVDSWVLPLVVVALVAGLIWSLHVRPLATIVSDGEDHAPPEAGGIDVYRWENDGGAAAIGFGGKYAKSPDPV